MIRVNLIRIFGCFYDTQHFKIIIRIMTDNITLDISWTESTDQFLGN